jgi:lipoyl(octanoyl) transferase
MNAPLPNPTPVALEAYLLGEIPLDTLLALQRRLVYEVSGDESRAALILCEHPPIISVGRDGSRAHIHFDADELRRRNWSVRWVGRGGGCLLHVPGQLAIYPILPLDRLNLSLGEYIQRLQAALLAVAEDYCVWACVKPNRVGLWVGNRILAHIGVAMRDGVAFFGANLNVSLDPEPFRRIRGSGCASVTTLEKEKRAAIRPSEVRTRVLDRILTQFPVERVSVFHHHPVLSRKPFAHATLAAIG